MVKLLLVCLLIGSFALVTNARRLRRSGGGGGGGGGNSQPGSPGLPGGSSGSPGLPGSSGSAVTPPATGNASRDHINNVFALIKSCGCIPDLTEPKENKSEWLTTLLKLSDAGHKDCAMALAKEFSSDLLN